MKICKGDMVNLGAVFEFCAAAASVLGRPGSTPFSCGEIVNVKHLITAASSATVPLLRLFDLDAAETEV